MSIDKHTHGPLVYDGQHRIDSVEFHKLNERGYMQGLVAIPYACGAIGDPSYDPTENGQANARRIVACWNACLNVPTEVLEAQQDCDTPWSGANQPARKVLQRELLTELEAAHQLLLLALGCMTTKQQAKFAAESERQGLGTDGATRHHERAAVIALATAGAT